MEGGILAQAPEQKLEPNPKLEQTSIQSDQPTGGDNAPAGSQTMQPMDGKDLEGDGNDGNMAKGNTGGKELTEEEKKQREAEEKEREREEAEREEERKKAEEAAKAAEEKRKKNLAFAEERRLEAEKEAEALEAKAEAAKERQEAAENEVATQRKEAKEAAETAKAARAKAEDAVKILSDVAIAAAEAAERAREKASAAEKAEKTRKDAESKKKEATEAATKAAEAAAKAATEGQMDKAEGEEGKKKSEEAERLKGIAEEAAKRAEEAEEAARQAEAEAKKAAKEAEEAKKAAEAVEEKRKEKSEEALKETDEMVRLEKLAKDKKEAEKAIPEKLGEAAKAEKEKNAAGMEAAGKRKAAEAAVKFGETNAADLGEDAFNTELLNMMIEAGGVDVRHEEEEGDDRKFDTLSDLKNLPQDTDNTDNTDNTDEGEGDKQKDKDLQEKRKQVNKLRRGNLYKAVIISRILKPENADKNYDGAEELKAQKEKAEGQGEQLSRFSRFSRFMNSSKVQNGVDKGFDIVGKANKTMGAVSGIAALASGSYKKSGLFTGISIASDVITMVCTVRGIIKKVKALKGKAASGSEKALAIVGLASDIFMILAKIASLTQSIGGLHKMSNADKRIARIVQDACTLASQATGMAGICDSLRQTVNSKKKLEGEQDKAKKEVEAIVRKAMGQDALGNGKGDEQESKAPKKENALDGESKDGEASGKIPLEKTPLEKGASDEGLKKETLEQSKGRRRLKKKNAPDKKPDEDLPNQVVAALNNPDNNLSEDEKETLLSYLIREKLISKKERAIVTTAAGLITNVIGMGSVITKEVSSETNSSDGSKTNEAASTANTVFGALSNAFVIGTNAIMPVTGAIADKVSKGDEETRLIKDGLWNALSSLGKDEYGLRGIANGLDSKEKGEYNVAKAENAVKKYEVVEKRLSNAGVDYNKLFAATNLEKFKDALVAGL